MSDPRLDDPRFETRHDPVLQRNRAAASAGTTWAWIGGIAAVILIAVLVLGNWHTGTDTGTPPTASNPAVTAPGATPSTTGAGGTSPAPAPARPATPAPAAPAAPNAQ
ncbi:MAG: hypothetical protein KIT76_14940 [Pseudolabrys sp.]|nr:hypothetical protein [Pseudolabrys sp.]